VENQLSKPIRGVSSKTGKELNSFLGWGGNPYYTSSVPKKVDLKKIDPPA
jgi:hypothetical protein